MPAQARSPSCLLIDAMGTLIELKNPAPRLVEELRERFAIEVTMPQAQDALAAEISYYRQHMLEGRDRATVAALRADCAQALRRSLPDSEALQRLDQGSMTEALVASLQFAVYDDAEPALRALRARGVAVVVVSNWDSSLPDALARLGLTPLLDGVVTSAAVGAAKPQPAIFTAALDVVGASSADALHVGDSISEDVAGARAAGIDGVWLNRDGALDQPGVTTITTLAQLSELF